MRKTTADGAVKCPGMDVHCVGVSVATLKGFIRASLPATAMPPGLGRIGKARAYIHRLELILRESPDLSITLSDLAQILDLEKTYCCKVFRRITDKSFSEWIRGIRIGRAQALLRVHPYTITHVSHAVGYGDITTFERAFRKELGLSPRSFRRLARIATPVEPAMQDKMRQTHMAASGG